MSYMLYFMACIKLMSVLRLLYENAQDERLQRFALF